MAGLAAGNDVFGTQHRDDALAHELTHVVQRSALVVQTAPAAIGEKRKRSDSEMDLDTDLVIGGAGGSATPPAKRQNLGPLKRSKSQEDLANRRPRTNSIILEGSERMEKGKPIFEAQAPVPDQGQGPAPVPGQAQSQWKNLLDVERNSADGKNLHRQSGLTFADAAVFATFSRESSRQFSNEYWKLIEKKRFRPGTERGDSDEHLTKNVADTKDISNADMTKQFEALLANKNIPHVITVLEGHKPSADQQEIKVKMASLAVPYKMITHQLLGANNLVNSVTLYVRSDLEKVYSPKVVEILAKNQQRTKMTNFECLAVDYDDVDGNHFRIINVHIPNKNTGSVEVDGLTRKAFEEYAEKCAREDPPVLVTCYTGDTNFKKVLVETHLPSYGGRRSNDSTLSARSSSAAKPSVFMQAVPFDLTEILGPQADGGQKAGDGQKADDDAMAVDDVLKGIPHVVLQPSTLNYLQLADSGDITTDTDHPSHSVTVLHKHALAKRYPAAFKQYYEGDQ
ncbi:hypothetical protein [Kineosporia babensis]|uniref:DUF4157 domain-containing protein n=1 Tax=Kineosporia babensis TaxID=499548 RepID=A0A9X1NBA2_9ACTN|nr:hypothetical protein [Kineosporia babensis]MCD5310545.1 hypothetical protein [Kineosporia babensis]